MENASLTSDESSDGSRAASVGTGSVVSWAQRVACQPYVIGTPAKEWQTLEHTNVALRTTRGTVTKTTATARKGGLRKGTLRYSGTNNSISTNQKSAASLQIDSDDEADTNQRLVQLD